MSALRHRLTSGALAMIVLQLTLLLAAPLSACCAPDGRSKTAATKVESGRTECCPAGSHAPGECPRHRRSSSAAPAATTQAPMDRGSKDSDCRMTCGAKQQAQFLLGAVGVLAAPQSTHLELTTIALHASAPVNVTVRPSVPDAPPPRFL